MPNKSSIAKNLRASHLVLGVSEQCQRSASRPGSQRVGTHGGGRIDFGTLCASEPLRAGEGSRSVPAGRRRSGGRIQMCHLALATMLLLITYAGAGEIPVAKFTDITRQAGILFTHVNGAYGEKLLPEAMGGGVAFLDYDNDDHQDLLFVNSTYWPGHVPKGTQPPTLALYHNDGHGHFTDVTQGSGLEVSYYGMGVAIGDYDTDGSSDIFIT